MTERVDLEVVVLATDQAEVLGDLVGDLHRRLSARLGLSWRLTVVDHGSGDATAAVAAGLAVALPSVEELRLPERLTKAEVHEHWAARGASTVAFVTVTPALDLDATVETLAQRCGVATPSLSRRTRGISRRTALAGLGGLGVTALIAACSRSSGEDTATTSPSAASTTSAPGGSTSGSTTTATAVGSPSAMVLVPEMTEGPYYLDLDLVRRDIREDRAGAALALAFTVVDATSGDPIPGAAVDLWHCDAEGIYSGFVAASEGDNGNGPGGGGTTDDTVFLRGTQIAGDDGVVRFITVYPGWYRGRTVHMHMKAHVTRNVVHTSQLFFDDGFTDEVYASTEPYASRGERDQRNESDRIYSDGGEAMTLAVASGGPRYAAAMTLGVTST